MKSLALSALATLALTDGVAAAQAPAGCGVKETPAQLCAYLTQTPALAGDAGMQAASQRCVAFYGEALASMDLLCDYRNNLQAAASEEATDTAPWLALQSSYLIEAELHEGRLKALAAQGQKTLTKLESRGQEVLETELRCDMDGTAGAPPGALTVGLSRVSLEAQKQAVENVAAALHLFALIVGAEQRRARDAQVARLRAGVGAAAVAYRPRSAPETFAAFLKQLDLAEGGAEWKDPVERARVKVPRHGVSPSVLIGGAAAPVARPVKDAVKTMFCELFSLPKRAVSPASLVLQFLLSDKKDVLTVMGIGAGALVATAGLGAAPEFAAAVAIDFAQNELRRLELKEEARLINPYLDHLRVDGLVYKADSQLASRSFQKLGRPYCKRCGRKDVMPPPGERPDMECVAAINRFNPYGYLSFSDRGVASGARPQTAALP